MKDIKKRDFKFANVNYPENKNELSDLINSTLIDYREENIVSPYGIISPYANYRNAKRAYGHSYSQLIAENFDTIIIIAPMTKIAFEGFALTKYDCFSNPLGDIEIDKESAKFLNKFDKDYFFYDDKHHDNEYTIESQLPYISYIFKNKIQILPILVGLSNTKVNLLLSKALHSLISKSKKKFFIVVCTNLSSNLKYEDAVNTDNNLIGELLKFNPDNFAEQLAMRQIIAHGGCGIISLLRYGEMINKKNIKILDSYNTGDITDNKLKVEGYFSVVFW